MKNRKAAVKTPKDELRHAKTADENKSAVRRIGWTIEHGKTHDHAVPPLGAKFAMPRHNGDLPKGTLFSIISRALLSISYILIESGLLR